MHALVADLGGRHITCAIVRRRNILRSRTIPVSAGAKLETTLSVLSRALKDLAAAEQVPLPEFAGVAVGFCGIVSQAEARVLAVNGKYEDAPELDLRNWAQREFGLPIFLENDARLALLGERYAGAAAGFDDVVMVTLGTGIGGAAMIGGHLLTGRHFQAGCLGGHLPLRVDGAECACGGSGCAESEASGWSLPGICRNWPGFRDSLLAREELNFETLFRCAGAGDAVAQRVRDHCLQIWATNAVALIHAYDPELVVYGGGVMQSGDLIVKFVQEHVMRRAWTPWGKVQVRPAQLGNNAALLGAIPLIESGQLERTNVR
jgi:glucokinase